MKFNPKPFRLCFRILAFITPFAFLLRLFTYWFEVESATGFFKGQGLSCTLYNVLGFIVFAICFAFVALTKSPVPTPENKLVPEEDFPEEYSDEVSAEYAEEYSDEAPAEYAEEYSDEAPVEYAEEYSDEAPAEYAEEYSQEAPAEYAEEYSQEAPVEYAEEYSQEAPAEYAEEYSQESTEAECALLAGGAPAQSFSLEEGAFPREENEALSPEEALEEEPEFLSSVMESGAEPKDRGSHRTVRHRSRRKVELLPDFCILCTTWQGTLSAFVTFLTGFAFFAYSLSFLTDPAMILDPYRQAFSLLSFLSGAYCGSEKLPQEKKASAFFCPDPLSLVHRSYGHRISGSCPLYQQKSVYRPVSFHHFRADLSDVSRSDASGRKNYDSSQQIPVLGPCHRLFRCQRQTAADHRCRLRSDQYGSGGLCRPFH